jgi:hypothetical protein
MKLNSPQNKHALGHSMTKKIYSQKKIRKKNLSRHSAKKKFLAWKIGL